MIDIHAHILPGVDDGSGSLEHSIEMLKGELNQGVNKIILTPHYRNGYVSSVEYLAESFENFKKHVTEREINVELFLGQEVYVTKDIKSLLKNKRVLTLNDSKFVLIEFSFTDREAIYETVHELKCEGFIPIVAHPERYSYIRIDDIYEIRNFGGLIQVNAESVVGENTRLCKKIVKKMFNEGLVDFVASDMHYGRANCMADAYAFVKRKFGDAAAEVTFKMSAERILKG